MNKIKNALYKPVSDEAIYELHLEVQEKIYDFSISSLIAKKLDFLKKATLIFSNTYHTLKNPPPLKELTEKEKLILFTALKTINDLISDTKNFDLHLFKLAVSMYQTIAEKFPIVISV